jgi:rod shape-determining protein MreD
VSRRAIGLAIALVVTSVVIQTSVFGAGRIQPFGASPALVLLVVIGCARYLSAEPALLIGFTAGLLVDLLGGSALGLWAMSYTVVAYAAWRVRERADDGPFVIGFGVLLLTVLGQSLFSVAGTLFGQRILSNPVVVKHMLLPAAYNVALAVLVLPLITRLLGDRRRGWAL